MPSKKTDKLLQSNLCYTNWWKIEFHIQIKVLTINAWSAKVKDHLISSVVKHKSTDFTVVAEAWLNDKGDAWVLASQLNQNGLQCHTNYRETGMGGIAFLSNISNEVKVIASNEAKSFESEVWSVNTTPKLTIVVIYRPPGTSSILQFTDEFSDFTMDVLNSHKNVVFLSDFNIHVNNLDSNDVLLFKSTLEALGLDQHVTNPTHKQGNILIIMATINKHQPPSNQIKDYISDLWKWELKQQKY